MDIHAIIMLIILGCVFIYMVVYARKNSDLTNEVITYKDEFDSEFYNEREEIIILARDNCKGGAFIDQWLKISGRFYVAVDCKTGELLDKPGYIQWLVKKNEDYKNQDYVFDIQKNHIYRIIARKSIPKELEPYQSKDANNRYMLVNVLETDCHNEILEQLKDKYTKEVVIDNELGHFALNRDYSWFESKIDWNGSNVTIYLKTESDLSDTADTAMNTLKKLVSNKNEFDYASREYAASELLSLANDWNVDFNEEDYDENEDYNPKPITKEEFIKRIHLEEMIIYSNGYATLCYNDGDLFLGHVIVIQMDNNGEYGGADIEG